MAKQHDLHSWLNALQGKSQSPLGSSITRGMAQTLLPAEGEEWIDGEPAQEPLTEFDFDAWPVGARLGLEQELQDRNMEHLWRGHRLIVASRLEETVDDLLDDLAADALARKNAGSKATASAGTRYCPACDGEFVAGIEECPDCGIPLVDERPAPVAKDEPTTSYDLSEWSPESRYLLSHELAAQWPIFANPHFSLGTSTARGYSAPGFVHAWDGTTLVVREADSEHVEAMLARVEKAVDLSLDPELDKLAYDVDDMSDESLTALLQALVNERVPHELTDDGELFVHEADEETVERLLDGIDFPDALPAQESDELEDPDDGLIAQRVLSDIFEACDRLVHDVRNADAILELVQGADRIEELAVPFGFDRKGWQALTDQIGALRDLLEAYGDLDVDGATEEARTLRDALRSLV